MSYDEWKLRSDRDEWPDESEGPDCRFCDKPIHPNEARPLTGPWGQVYAYAHQRCLDNGDDYDAARREAGNKTSDAISATSSEGGPRPNTEEEGPSDGE